MWEKQSWETLKLPIPHDQSCEGRIIVPISYTPSIPINQVILDKISVKHWEYLSWITFKLLSLKMWKLHEYICLAKYFHKGIHMLVLVNVFKNKKSVVLWRPCRYAKRVVLWVWREYRIHDGDLLDGDGFQDGEGRTFVHVAAVRENNMFSRHLVARYACKVVIGEDMDKSTLVYTQIQIIINQFLPSPISPIPK
jgi:hypothetical protein